jgi:GT2 family glycosyltransferase
MQSKYLVGIPCLYGSEVTRNAIQSVIEKTNVDVLVIDNGADEDVKRVIEEFFNKGQIIVVRNEKNIFVNPAWNQILQYFLKDNSYDYCCIMNSDIIMQPEWNDVLNIYHKQYPDNIPIAKHISDITKIKDKINLDAFNE